MKLHFTFLFARQILQINSRITIAYVFTARTNVIRVYYFQIKLPLTWLYAKNLPALSLFNC